MFAFHVEVLAQDHPILDSLFMIGQLQISQSGHVSTDHIIPAISRENGEVVFDQLNGKNKLLVIKSWTEGILKIGDNNFPIIKDYLHHFPINKEEKVSLGWMNHKGLNPWIASILLSCRIFI